MRIRMAVIIIMVWNSACFLDYNNQANWPSSCINEQAGSPINIVSSKVIVNDNLYDSIFVDYPNLFTEIELRITQDSVFQFSYFSHNKNSITLTQNKVEQTYWLVNTHLHCGSEHQIDGHAFDCELHLVHKQAVDNNELVVISVPIARSIDRSEYKTAEVNDDRLFSTLFLSNGQFYHYNGGLTVPPCSSTPVTWLILKDNIKISNLQLTRLQEWIFNFTLNLNGQNLKPYQYAGNSRNLQPLNNRKIEEVGYIVRSNASRFSFLS